MYTVLLTVDELTDTMHVLIRAVFSINTLEAIIRTSGFTVDFVPVLVARGLLPAVEHVLASPDDFLRLQALSK